MNTKLKHPKGIYLLFTVEMWERFSYYGMRAILVLYMIKYLMFSTEEAGSVYGWYTGLVYLGPVFGGYLADRYLGQRFTIILGALIMALGHFTLAFEQLTFFYAGLVLLIIGNGFFKPNASAMVGQLYETNDPRRDGGYTIFYMGVNLGAFFSPFVCGTLGEKVGWHYGFGAAGIGMVIGLLIFMIFQNKYLGDIGKKPMRKDPAHKADNEKPLTKEEWQRIFVIFLMAFFVIFFWVSFEQAGTSLTLFAERETDRFIPFLNWEFPTSWFQSVNPLFIVILAPIMSSMWIHLGNKDRDPSTPAKFIWGLMLLAFGFVLMAFAAYVYKTSGPVNVLWLLGCYFFLTLGELCLSPIGLSLVSKLAPAKFLSLLMGTWFLSNVVANWCSGLFGGQYDSMDHSFFFSIPVMMAVGASIVLFIMKPFIKKMMHGVK